jgi:hypothetical protein
VAKKSTRISQRAEPARGVDPLYDLSDVVESWRTLAGSTGDPHHRAIATVLDALDALAARPDEPTLKALVKVAARFNDGRREPSMLPDRRELAERIASSLEASMKRQKGPFLGAEIALRLVAALEEKGSEDLAALEARRTPDAESIETRTARVIDQVNVRLGDAHRNFSPRRWAEAYVRAIWDNVLGKPVPDVLSGRAKRDDHAPSTAHEPHCECNECCAAEARSAEAYRQSPEGQRSSAERLQELARL